MRNRESFDILASQAQVRDDDGSIGDDEQSDEGDYLSGSVGPGRRHSESTERRRLSSPGQRTRRDKLAALFGTLPPEQQLWAQALHVPASKEERDLALLHAKVDKLTRFFGETPSQAAMHRQGIYTAAAPAASYVGSCTALSRQLLTLFSWLPGGTSSCGHCLMPIQRASRHSYPPRPPALTPSRSRSIARTPCTHSTTPCAGATS